MSKRWEVRTGDALALLREMPDASVNCCVTSPPYYGLRDYGVDGQVGLEPTPGEYVAKLVAIFAEVRRVLRDDGTCWVNLGDSYANKSLVGIPWAVAFALRGEGWFLRSDIIWSKPNAMPEPANDRPSSVHEHIFLLSKSARYAYDIDAIREKHKSLDEDGNHKWTGRPASELGAAPHKVAGTRYSAANANPTKGAAGLRSLGYHPAGRNAPNVWTVCVSHHGEEHYASYPEELARRCILAGCPKGGLVLDPFCGSGTTGIAALGLQRRFVGIELNPAYAEMSRRRIGCDSPLFDAAAPAPSHAVDCDMGVDCSCGIAESA